MPVRYGRGCGVIGVTLFVALWTEDSCPMLVRCARGRGVSRVTSWVALWTED